ncbi:SDR family NAD(P)-dependent oxidoreductase [Phycicoccus endophyticus]|uniref:SDR family NAD(P)-dependent oxidoreductase n=1 Tax=Phycicoccus endophyticus TaxID=1690220 RepID=A0A7G9R3B9_9MICO|nr:SDR family NAD(P)-dependent oxidoreductase [Phycicoccus endophyticus]NHI19842.1 SDR family NAD(P)-dependent oxidoreductase [Phycicoccus endophyticus]QNN50094.1 SDR family NAD(P)-dependent oxidoreductase [Phycicoccus endophyticus]GGL28128.1 oxidoreductase [Phycicoccus endophyticus]
MDLSNDVILITGGTSGIGLEMAEQLAARGNTVIVTGRDEDRLSQFRESHPGLFAYAVEVTDLASVETLYRQIVSDFPNLNVVINNAGLMQNIEFQSFAPARVTDEVAVNLAGPILVTQVFLPHLLKQSEAAVLNVTSGIAYFAFDKAPVYSASKLGLHSYTQTLRKQLAGTSVKVFELAPPRTTKPMFNGSDEDNREVDRIPKMPIERVVAAMIGGMKRNRCEILPGMSKLLRLIGKIRL